MDSQSNNSKTRTLQTQKLITEDTLNTSNLTSPSGAETLTIQNNENLEKMQEEEEIKSNETSTLKPVRIINSFIGSFKQLTSHNSRKKGEIIYSRNSYYLLD